MNYFERRQLIAQGLALPESKKTPGKKKIEPVEGIITLDEWYLERRKEMTGKCWHCGGRSCRDDNIYFKHSIAHILPKRPGMFPSIATHPLNFMELCFWNHNHHAAYDNHILELTQLNCFDQVIDRIVKMYPDIDKKERKNLPDLIMQYIDTVD